MLLEKCEANFYTIINDIGNGLEKNRLIDAYNLAKNAHEGQKRKS